MCNYLTQRYILNCTYSYFQAYTYSCRDMAPINVVKLIVSARMDGLGSLVYKLAQRLEGWDRCCTFLKYFYVLLH